MTTVLSSQLNFKAHGWNKCQYMVRKYKAVMNGDWAELRKKTRRKISLYRMWNSIQETRRRVKVAGNRIWKMRLRDMDGKTMSIGTIFCILSVYSNNLIYAFFYLTNESLVTINKSMIIRIKQCQWGRPGSMHWEGSQTLEKLININQCWEKHSVRLVYKGKSLNKRKETR